MRLMPKITYLDYAAGTPLNQAGLKKLIKQAGRLHYNPSAIYEGGLQAKELLEEARQTLAGYLQVKQHSLIFTAGASDANRIVVETFKNNYPEGRIACLNTDHPSMLELADQILAVDPEAGRLDPAGLDALDKEAVCLSLAGVNNETGLIQPIAKIKQALDSIGRARKTGRPCLHIDASQMSLTSNLSSVTQAADLVTVNGAKSYALKQTGLLYISDKINLKPASLKTGQERGFRLGSESLLNALSLVSGFGKIAQRREQETARLAKLQAHFENQLQDLGARIVLKNQKRSVQITSAIFPSQDAHNLALALSSHHIYVGLGAACQTDQETNHVLSALGCSLADMKSCLRFSFGYETNQKQLEQTVAVLKKSLC